MLRYHYSIFIFLVLIISSFTNQVLGQETIPDEVIIDYSGVDKTLREVLFDISEIAEVPIAFQEEIIPGDSLINFSVRQQEIGVVVNYLLDRHRVKYRVIGDQLVLYKDPYANSRKNVTISGYITDKLSGESLLGANIFLGDKLTGTESNSYGYYSFTIPKGDQSVYYSYLGYNTEILNLTLAYDTIINVKLDPNNLLNEIVISDRRIEEKTKPKEPVSDLEAIPIEKISSKLPLAGEPDLMRLAYTLPGVTSGADGFGGMSVRGGSTNQNLILFDGIPVYNSNHLFGMFSIFNTNVIKSAKLYKGAFPSHFSGRLSSVLDIRTRDGNNQKFGGDISLGLLTAKASIEGPIKKGRSSFLLSARRTTADLWIDAVNDLVNNNPLTNRETGIKFYDLNAKLNFSIGKQSKLMLSYYKGNDDFDNKLTTDSEDMTVRNLNEITWQSGNELASIKYQIPLGKRIFLNASVYKSDYLFESFDHDRVELTDSISFRSNYDAGFYQTNISDLGARLDFDLIPNPRHYLKIGGGYIRHIFSPEFTFSFTGDGLLDSAQEIADKKLLMDVSREDVINANELEFYIEDNISLGKYTALNIGYNHMLVSMIDDGSNKPLSIYQPRILFSTGTAKYRLKLSWGRMGQFLHSLSNTGLGVPSDIWLPSTNLLPPEVSWNASMGHEFNFRNQTQFSLDLFYKKMKNVTRNGIGILHISADSDWESNIPLGTGLAYGTELRLKNSIGKTNFDIAYTWSKSNRNYPNVNNGNDIRFRYDRRHVVNISFIQKLNENIEISSNWEYGSGTPIEYPSDSKYIYLDFEGNETEVEVNRDVIFDELRSYHRLDFGFNFYSQYKWGESKLTLGVYNIYDRVNPLYIDKVATSDNNIEYQQFYLFKLMPTFNYTLSF